MDTLFVIDMQNDFIKPDGALYLGHDTSKLVSNIVEFIKEFKGKIIYTQDSHSKTCCEFTKFPPHCTIGSKGWDIVSEIKEIPTNGITLKKSTYTPIKDLRDLIIQDTNLNPTYHITGVCTHICVHDIAAYIVNIMKEHNNTIPKIKIYRNKIDDFDKEMADFSLKRLENLYGVSII